MLFATALNKILDLEGRVFESHPLDRGGDTKNGITQATYDRYRNRKGLPVKSVRYITDAETSEIYSSDYWVPMGCSKLPDGLDFAVFQAGVNFGTGTAVKMLQGVVGVTRDGSIGPMTLAAIKKMGVKTVIEKFLDAQRARYEGIVAKNPTQEVFLRGWFNRVSETAAFIAKPAAGLLVLVILGVIIYIILSQGKGVPHAA